mmetsp:Transcript_27964/g.90391  ORF Transcript_27964/g.90391 Transcript_27964/m.90391 type:complete len:204 (+) Transcript_27964:119-730(+)
MFAPAAPRRRTGAGAPIADLILNITSNERGAPTPSDRRKDGDEGVNPKRHENTASIRRAANRRDVGLWTWEWAKYKRSSCPCLAACRCVCVCGCSMVASKLDSRAFVQWDGWRHACTVDGRWGGEAQRIDLRVGVTVSASLAHTGLLVGGQWPPARAVSRAAEVRAGGVLPARGGLVSRGLVSVPVGGPRDGKSICLGGLVLT